MKQNSATLGFLPFEALTEYQQRGGILGAKTEDNELAGYLLHSKQQTYFRIVHLCVSGNHRAKRIARSLVCELRNSATTQRLIRLHCRRDYPANDMWPILGFVPLEEKPGRSSAGHLLTHWSLTLAQDRQLELFQALTLDDHLDAVVDAQVFFDFYEPASSKALPSKALLSDFLIDTLNLWATDELLVEIDRNPNRSQRNRSRQRAYAFRQIKHEPTLANHFETILRTLLPSNTNSQISDIRHLAKTAASDSNTFVTRDGTLLSHAKEIRELLNVSVLSPTQLIITAHELSEKDKSDSNRISGTQVSWRYLTSSDLSRFPTASFVEPSDRHGPFREKLDTFLAQPHWYECTVLQMAGTIVALRVLDTREDDCIHVPFVSAARLRDRGLLERFVIADTLARAIATNRRIVRFENSGIMPRMAPALLDTGFMEGSSAYVRYTIPHSTTRQQVLAWLSTQCPNHHAAFRSLDDLELQRRCSPLSLTGTTQVYMVPIRPDYAMSLFDISQARQDLFGGNTSILFRWENVYYRTATHTRLIRAPGRILWYVSAPKKSVVAISNLDSVLVDRPKELFRTFEKFGILDWKELYNMCDGDVAKKLMAMKFSHTFLFRKPVPLSELNGIYGDHGKRPVLQSPSRISPQIYETVVERGFGVQQ